MHTVRQRGDTIAVNEGTVIEGKYEILRKIGKGGMSTVYLAADKRLHKEWAVKEIQKVANDKANGIAVQSLLREANFMKNLDHPSLPRIVDIIDTEHTIFVVMDYIEGESLDKVLAAQGVQPEETVIEWAIQLCDVLGYLHSREPAVIYRDMKPANVMLRPGGNLKVIDFGIAREYKEHNTEDTVSLGTRGYAAPEQFGGRGQTDARTDIYCLGVTLYYLLTGKNPCDSPYELYPIRYWNPYLSEGMENIILKCTACNPEDRYQSCAELRNALEYCEEVEDANRNRQQKHSAVFLVMAVICVVMTAAGMMGSALPIQENSKFMAGIGFLLCVSLWLTLEICKIIKEIS